MIDSEAKSPAVRSASFSWIAPKRAIGTPLLARVRVGRAGPERELRCAGHRRAELEPADVEDVEGDLVTLADLAEHVLDRHLGALEDDGRRGGALDAELLLLRAGRDSRGRALDEERGEVLPVHAGEHREQVGEAAVRDELLRPLEDVVLAVGRERRGGLPPRASLPASGSVRQYAALHSPVTSFRGSDPSEPPSRSRRAAACRCRCAPHRRRRTHRRAHPLRREHARRLVEREPAVRLGRVDHEQARVARLAHERDGDARLLVLEPVEDGGHLLRDELIRGVGDGMLLLGEVLGVKTSSFVASVMRYSAPLKSLAVMSASGCLLEPRARRARTPPPRPSAPTHIDTTPRRARAREARAATSR